MLYNGISYFIIVISHSPVKWDGAVERGEVVSWSNDRRLGCCCRLYSPTTSGGGFKGRRVPGWFTYTPPPQTSGRVDVVLRGRLYFIVSRFYFTSIPVQVRITWAPVWWEGARRPVTIMCRRERQAIECQQFWILGEECIEFSNLCSSFKINVLFRWELGAYLQLWLRCK